MKFKLAGEGSHAHLCGAFMSDNGRYKIVKYGDHWTAYFKPGGWPSFGNSCEKDAQGTMHYPTRQKAQEAAIRHLSEFGLEAESNQYLRG
jgi:hypothetical protein